MGFLPVRFLHASNSVQAVRFIAFSFCTLLYLYLIWIASVKEVYYAFSYEKVLLFTFIRRKKCKTLHFFGRKMAE